MRRSACVSLAVMSGLVCTASGAMAAGAHTATEMILHSFTGDDGAHPLGGVTLQHAGKEQGGTPTLYGTAYSGGKGKGVVFSIRKGAFSVLHAFGGPDGKFPQAGLTEGPDGTFYGTLAHGGYTGGSKQGYGAVFSMTPGGHVTILHQFQGPEGAVPVAPVTLDSAGDILGTTQYGGSSSYSGTLYKLTPDGTASVLADFSATRCQGGLGAVTLDPKGDIFGTTWMSTDHPFGCVWEYRADGAFKALHLFDNKDGGREPRAGVAMDAAGNLYGANYYRGKYQAGTIFRTAPDGTQTVLHHFKCGTDGGYPFGGLLLAGDGKLYGTNSSCGAGGGGVVFSYDTTTGAFRTLYAFHNTGSDGYLPIGPLSMDEKGNLYGATEYGGADNLGIVFEIMR